MRNLYVRRCFAPATAVLLLGACLPPTPVCGPLEPAPTIDWQEASYLANLVLDVTHTANVSDEELLARYGQPGVTLLIRQVPANGDRYVVMLDPDHQMQTIVLPGTHLDSRSDVLTDLDFKLFVDQELGIRVDSGFRAVARSVRRDVYPLLNQGYRTQVFGYSMGGGVAVLLAAYMAQDGYAIDRIVTFGQPSVTDAVGVQALSHLPLTRFKSASDIVPDLPPASYRHFGPQIILLDGPYFVYLPVNDRNYDCSTELMYETRARDASVNDHFTYAIRTGTKLAGPNTPVTFCDRAQFIQAQVPIDLGAPPP